jgi:hypothetical protein
MPGSPAIDAGDGPAATAAGLTADQRGPLFARVSGATVDVGAFEVQTLPATTPPPINVTTPAPPSPPQITGALVLHIHTQNKPGKPVLIGFQFSFNTAMNQATVENRSNYSPGVFSISRVRRQGKVIRVIVLHPLAFTVRYDSLINSVELVLRGKQTFPQGGQITLFGTPPSGISDVAGRLLDGNGSGTGGTLAVYTISRNAGGLVHA